MLSMRVSPLLRAGFRILPTHAKLIDYRKKICLFVQRFGSDFDSTKKCRELEYTAQPTKIFSMDWKVLGTAFLTLFLAELGDKTQLAVITMSAREGSSKLAVFVGASLALILVTLLAVAFGSVLTQFVPVDWLQRIVALAFITIGVLMLFGIL